MAVKMSREKELTKTLAAQGGIIVFFIMAFEVMIMISPFAFFFYSVFNPVFHWLNGYTATRWLTSFFLPHMILPPTMTLKAIRVLGSCLFVAGSVTFLICALQVYLGKIFHWGIANKGLYASIRHPQYLALGVWGLGMAILWPRFIVLATLSIMFILYHSLARDEERRMTKQFGETYERYMGRTGMFVPRSIEGAFRFGRRPWRHNALKHAVMALCLIAMMLGSGFILRQVTLRSLDLERKSNITLVSILPEDDALLAPSLDGILASVQEQKVDFLRKKADYLGYLMPADYVMQGMIADTGEKFHLYKKRHTLALIADWVINPFEHLRRPPSALMAREHHMNPRVARRRHCPIGINSPDLTCDRCPYRRVVMVEIEHGGTQRYSGINLFSFNANRKPVGFVDIDTRTGKIVSAHEVGRPTAWQDVPTPAI